MMVKVLTIERDGVLDIPKPTMAQLDGFEASSIS
jgi:hypothetical protein